MYFGPSPLPVPQAQMLNLSFTNTLPWRCTSPTYAHDNSSSSLPPSPQSTMCRFFYYATADTPSSPPALGQPMCMFFDNGFHALPHRHPPPSCRFFDYGAQADRAILHKALEDVAPRHLLLPRGTAVEREELARHARITLRDFGTQVALPDPAGGGEVGPSAAASCSSSSSSSAHTVVVPLPPSFTLFLSDELNATLGLGRMQR